MCARAHTHTEAPTYKHSDYTKLKIHSLKTGSKRPGDLEWIKTRRTENMATLQFLEKKGF